MPQIAAETFFTQYFWLLVIFFVFNDFILHKFIPGVAKLIKARKETSTYISKKIEQQSINIELPVFNTAKSTKIINFNDTRVNWINKQNK